MSLKRRYNLIDDPQNQGSSFTSSDEPDSYESSPIEDRQSRFIALYSPSTTLTPKDLQRHEAYQKASHRILAWRLPSKQQTVHFPSQRAGTTNTNIKPLYDVGSLDDGEKYAGKRLEKVLIELDVVGSIVVARWYGGVLLGPVRFEHIQECARDAIGKYRKGRGADMVPTAKKVKVDELELTPQQEAEQRTRLVKVLGDRDNSISVLRQLLAEKKAFGKSTTDEKSKEVPASPSPQAKPNYNAMTLARLRQLEKARDTTIAWILRQIDEAEAVSKPSGKGTPHKPNG